MKITGVEMFPVVNPGPQLGGEIWMLLRLDTDEGVSGYGELFTNALPWRPAVTAKVIEDLVADLLTGHEVSAVEQLYWKIYNLAYSHASDLTKSAITSALDMACYDIMGKSLGVPAYVLLGGLFRERVRSYTYIYPAPSGPATTGALWSDPGAVAERAISYVERGFTALKLDPLPFLAGREAHAHQVVPVQFSAEVLDGAERVIAELRRAVGPACDLLVGTHGQMTTAAAVRLARRLEAYDPLWFEEPVPPELAEEMAVVARASRVPIAAGERLTSKWECARLIRHQAVSVLNIDVSQVGGLLEAKKVAALAEANYVQVSPHCFGGPLVAAASVQLAAACPNVLIVEAIETYGGAHAELLDTPIEWVDGDIVPSARPGLGHNLDERVARRLAPDATYTKLR